MYIPYFSLFVAWAVLNMFRSKLKSGIACHCPTDSDNNKTKTEVIHMVVTDASSN